MFCCKDVRHTVNGNIRKQVAKLDSKFTGPIIEHSDLQRKSWCGDVTLTRVYDVLLGGESKG